MRALHRVSLGVTTLLCALAMGMLLYGCATTRSAAPRTEKHRLVLSKCGGCHLIPKAHGLPIGDAQRILSEHDNRVRLSSEEARDVIDFLAGPSDDPPSPR